jgi:hypothetical protein
MKFRICAFFILLLLSQVATSQEESKLRKFRKLHFAEKLWVLGHPFKASKALNITNLALEKTRQIKNTTILDGDENGGQVDAFRHGYWMALLAKEIGKKSALKLGRAHEKGNKADFRKHQLEEGTLPDKAAGLMDLQNNLTGANLGILCKNKTNDEIGQIIISEIKKGKFIIIGKNKSGQFIDNEGQIIDMQNFRKQWKNPKSLVSSDFIKP